MDSNKAQEIGHDLETYGYDKSVDNGASFYGEDSGHCALFFADYENPVYDGPRKKSAQEELNLNTENSGE